MGILEEKDAMWYYFSKYYIKRDIVYGKKYYKTQVKIESKMLMAGGPHKRKFQIQTHLYFWIIKIGRC